MRKIFLLIVLFAVMSFGQNRRLGGEFPTDQNYSKVSVLYTYDATDSTYHAVPGVTFSLPSGMTGSFSNAEKRDSLSGVSDTALFDFDGQFRSVYLTLRDTGSTYTDSLKVEVYNATLGTWSQKSVGLYRQYDQQNIGGDIVIPGAGLEKKYFLLDEFIDKVQVIWYYGLDKVGRKHDVIFYGSN